MPLTCENHTYGGGLSLQKNMNFEREHTNRGRDSPVHAATLWPNIQPGLEEVFVRGLSPLHPGRISCSSCLEPWPSESFISRSWLAWGWAAKEVIFWKLHLLGSGYGSSSYTTSILSFNFSQLNWMIKWTRWATLNEVPCKKPHVMHCRVRIDSLCRFMGSWERCPSSHGGW